MKLPDAPRRLLQRSGLPFLLATGSYALVHLSRDSLRTTPVLPEVIDLMPVLGEALQGKGATESSYWTIQWATRLRTANFGRSQAMRMRSNGLS